jgi:hypothetical protein
MENPPLNTFDPGRFRAFFVAMGGKPGIFRGFYIPGGHGGLGVGAAGFAFDGPSSHARYLWPAECRDLLHSGYLLTGARLLHEPVSIRSLPLGSIQRGSFVKETKGGRAIILLTAI